MQASDRRCCSATVLLAPVQNLGELQFVSILTVQIQQFHDKQSRKKWKKRSYLMQRIPMISIKKGDKFIVSRRYEKIEKELLPLSRGAFSSF